MNINIQLIILTFISSAAQLMIKIAADQINFQKLALQSLINKYLISGLLLYGISTLFTIYLLSRISLSKFSLFTSLSYIFTIFLAYIVLSERIGIEKMAGGLLIIVGVYIVSSTK